MIHELLTVSVSDVSFTLCYRKLVARYCLNSIDVHHRGYHPFGNPPDDPVYLQDSQDIPSLSSPRSSGDLRVEDMLRPDLWNRLSKRDKLMAKFIMAGCFRYHTDLAGTDRDGMPRCHEEYLLQMSNLHSTFRQASILYGP
jgi:hypothetical protein